MIDINKLIEEGIILGEEENQLSHIIPVLDRFKKAYYNGIQRVNKKQKEKFIFLKINLDKL